MASAHLRSLPQAATFTGGWLACLKDPVGHVGMGLKGRFKQARQVTSEEPDQKNSTGRPGWGLRLALTTPPRKTKTVAETTQSVVQKKL